MSRELLWEYTIPNGTQAMWDAYFNTCPIPGFSHHYCSGGGGDMAKDTWTIWIRGTKAKARRIATQLDQLFGGTGVVEYLPRVSDE